jgi:hypothetical protein
MKRSDWGEREGERAIGGERATICANHDNQCHLRAKKKSPQSKIVNYYFFLPGKPFLSPKITLLTKFFFKKITILYLLCFSA